MAIPLAVGASGEILLQIYRGSTFWTALVYPFTHQLVPIVLIVVTYFVVMFLIIRDETERPYEPANFALVKQQLKEATGYFALCDIPMREWFEPGAFKYFALLIATRVASGRAFRYDRVLVFTTPHRRHAAEDGIQDRYYSLAFLTAHKILGIPLGWLGPDELSEVISRLRPEHQQLFQTRPSLLKPAQFQLDFAVIDRPGGRIAITVPFKKSPAVVLEGDAAAPYLQLADEIRRRVFEADGTTLKDSHSFEYLLG